MKVKLKVATHDNFLARLPADKRAVLEKLRRTIRAAAPGVEECISYHLPTFRLDGKVVEYSKVNPVAPSASRYLRQASPPEPLCPSSTKMRLRPSKASTGTLTPPRFPSTSLVISMTWQTFWPPLHKLPAFRSKRRCRSPSSTPVWSGHPA